MQVKVRFKLNEEEFKAVDDMAQALGTTVEQLAKKSLALTMQKLYEEAERIQQHEAQGTTGQGQTAGEDSAQS